MTRTEQHHRNGKTYEIRGMRDHEGAKVHVFLEGKQIGVPYTAPADTDADLNTVAGVDALDELIKIAKDDIDRDHIG